MTQTHKFRLKAHKHQGTLRKDGTRKMYKTGDLVSLTEDQFKAFGDKFEDPALLAAKLAEASDASEQAEAAEAAAREEQKALDEERADLAKEREALKAEREAFAKAQAAVKPATPATPATPPAK